MARIIGIHNLELKPGVTAEDFEKFFNEVYLPNEPHTPDVSASLLKGDKGERVGQYTLVIEFASEEARERLFVDEAERTPEVQQTLENWEQLMTYVSTSWSDYVELYKK